MNSWNTCFFLTVFLSVVTEIAGDDVTAIPTDSFDIPLEEISLDEGNFSSDKAARPMITRKIHLQTDHKPQDTEAEMRSWSETQKKIKKKVTKEENETGKFVFVWSRK